MAQMFSFVEAIVEVRGLFNWDCKSKSLCRAFCMYFKATFGFYILYQWFQIFLLLVVASKIIHCERIKLSNLLLTASKQLCFTFIHQYFSSFQVHMTFFVAFPAESRHRLFIAINDDFLCRNNNSPFRTTSSSSLTKIKAISQRWALPLFWLSEHSLLLLNRRGSLAWDVIG